MKTRRMVLRGTAALALVGMIGACGSSKHAVTTPTSAAPTTSASQGTSAPTSAPASGPPIKVGMICSCTGAFGADSVDAADTYRAWVNTVNASGGLSGHPVQLIYEDDASTPGTSATDAATLVADHVDAIVDITILDEVWASTVQKANIPVVGANETEVPFYTNPDFYPEGQTNDSVTTANVLTAKAAGATNLADLYCAEAPSCQEGVAPIKAAGVAAGIPDVYNGEIAFTAPNYTAQCVAAQQAHVTAVFIGDESNVIARVGDDCAKQGFHPIYVTEGEGFGLVLANPVGVGANLWSEYGTIPFFDNITPVVAMNAAIDKYYPGIRSNTSVFTQFAAQSWASGLELADAVKNSGMAASDTPTPALITQGLDAFKGDTLQGMAPPLTFTAGTPHPIDCWFTARVQNGVPSIANNGQLTCSSGSS